MQKKAATGGGGSFSAGLLKNIKTVSHRLRLTLDFRKLRVLVILIVIGAGLYAGYFFKVPEKIVGIFQGRAPVAPQSTTAQKSLNGVSSTASGSTLSGETGVTNSAIFGDNRGNLKDLIAVQIINAYYFGLLSEPKIAGETGISPAYFYGTLADINAQKNRFIAYVANLRELVSSYDIDIYKMLDQSTKRDQLLTAHLGKLKDILDKSNKIVNELKLQIDDLKVSFDTLNPDKARFQTDFFAALEGLAGEKADFLLSSYIDVSQKQVALKARLAALQQLAVNYDSAIANLTIRVTSMEKNFAVLAQGLHVVSIPGANLKMIIQQNP